MNKVILVGRLTADPDLRQTQSGIASCRFTVAVDRKYKDSATGERQADFISCTAWRQAAEFISHYFNKGKMILVEGTLRNNNYQDKTHPDVMHYTMDVLVENVEFCGDKGNSPAPSADQAAARNLLQTAANAGVETAKMDYGSLSEFEEILSDGPVPF